MKNFSSVSTNAARFQDISLNPQKLAGMCAKLKCCLNYEVDQYMEAGQKLPPKDVLLQTQDSDYHLFKTDILAGLCTYSTDKNLAANVETITAGRAWEIIAQNRQGIKPLSLMQDDKAKVLKRPVDLLADADVSRFDKSKKKKKKKGRRPQEAKEQVPVLQESKGNDSPLKEAGQPSVVQEKTQQTRQRDNRPNPRRDYHQNGEQGDRPVRQDRRQQRQRNRGPRQVADQQPQQERQQQRNNDVQRQPKGKVASQQPQDNKPSEV